MLFVCSYVYRLEYTTKHDQRTMNLFRFSQKMHGCRSFPRTCILMELPSGAMISHKHLIGAIQKRLGTEMHSVVTAKTSTALTL